MHNQPDISMEDTVTFLLAKVSILHKNLLQRSTRSAGLYSGQVFVLMELWREDGQRQVDLAVKLGVSTPTINKILGGLLDGEYVRRAIHEGDARSTRIHLTARGLLVRSQVEKQWSILEEKTLEGFSDTEVIMLKQLLTRLIVGIV